MAQSNCFLIYCKMTRLHTWVQIANNWPIKTTLMIMYNKQLASRASKYYSRYNIAFIYCIVTTYLHYSVATFSCKKHYRHDLEISFAFLQQECPYVWKYAWISASILAHQLWICVKHYCALWEPNSIPIKYNMKANLESVEIKKKSNNISIFSF